MVQTATLPRPANGQAMQPSAEKTAEFVPFGGRDKIKLSVAIVQNLICVPTKSGHRCSDEDAIKFIMMCRAGALNPFAGDAFCVGFDTKDGPKFQLITAHQAFLKRAEVNPEFDGMESSIIVAAASGEMVDREGDFFLNDERLLGGWAVVHFKTRKHPMRKRVRLEAFRKPFGRWAEDPAGMIVKVAEADALRSAFPTQLGALYIEGELAPPQTERSNGTMRMIAPTEPAEIPAADAPTREPGDDPEEN